MQIILRTARYALPVAFFTYAAIFNIGYARFPGTEEIAIDRSALTGTLTAQLDSTYRQSLPHREGAIGLFGALRYLLVGEGRQGVVIGDEGWLFTTEEVRPLTDDLDQSLARIARVRNQLEESGARLVIVPVPGKLDVQVAHSDPETAAGVATLYDDFLAGLAARDVPVLDSRAALRRDSSQDVTFFRTDTHWTPHGARNVASALARSGLVPPGETSFSISAEPEERFTGDLVSYVTTDALAALLGLQPETARPYIATAEGDAGLDIFAGAAEGATLLVGTSYSANPLFSFAEALKLELGRDVLNLAVEGQGPARPMLDYLASAEFHEVPPELVIWEFPVRYLSDPEIWDDQGPKTNDPVQSGA
jgi:alginate O-acetyltransferase complex protein AlgJ